MKKLLVFLTLCGLLLITHIYIQNRRIRHEMARRELLQFRQELYLGESHSQVLKAFEATKRPSLRLHSDMPMDNEADLWLVTTPNKIGAVNWFLWLQFDDGKLVALRIRLMDDRGFFPKGAPEDTVAPDARDLPNFRIRH